jgi:hypothetical protein
MVTQTIICLTYYLTTDWFILLIKLTNQAVWTADIKKLNLWKHY